MMLFKTKPNGDLERVPDEHINHVSWTDPGRTPQSKTQINSSFDYVHFGNKSKSASISKIQDLESENFALNQRISDLESQIGVFSFDPVQCDHDFHGVRGEQMNSSVDEVRETFRTRSFDSAPIGHQLDTYSISNKQGRQTSQQGSIESMDICTGDHSDCTQQRCNEYVVDENNQPVHLHVMRESTISTDESSKSQAIAYNCDCGRVFNIHVMLK